jgi:AmmeMemoRadiSam system protein B
VRAASHSGSWYTNDARRLDQQIGEWMTVAKPGDSKRIRALISPHAGLSYSGLTASHAYGYVSLEGVKRIFILGPAHREYIPGIAVTPFHKWATPFGHMVVDTQMTQELIAASKPEATVSMFQEHADEDEHSLEMQTPFIACLLRDSKGAIRTDVKIVPIVVGCLTAEQELLYGRLLAPYLNDPTNLFCISSDFCHWGARFKYQHYDPKQGQIFESITALDHEGMDLIAKQDYAAWTKYLKTTRNTICGRVPISLLLVAMQTLGNPFQVEWTHYAQSQAVTSKNDSSVSYAAAVVF